MGLGFIFKMKKRKDVCPRADANKPGTRFPHASTVTSDPLTVKPGRKAPSIPHPMGETTLKCR